MPWIRHSLLVFLAVALASGCKTGSMSNLAPSRPVLPQTSSLEATELVKEHNRNAELITSLRAEPSIEAAQDGRRGALNGRLALERPKSFKLEVATQLSSVADIGSNDEEFWFWATTSEKAEKAVYYCNHEDLAKTPLAATFQPDWIIEAMSLRVITEDEAAEIRVKRDPKQPGRLILTHAPSRSGSQSFARVTVLDEKTHRILEHQVFTADKKTALARAVVVDGVYNEYKLPGVDGAPGELVYLPARVKLEWIKEKLALDVRMKRVQVNPKFTADQRTAMFTEPQRKDCARRNLAEKTGMASGGPTIRETRPAPPTRVRLGAPEDEARNTRQRTPIALAATDPDPPSLSDEVVGPPLPTAPEPAFLQAGVPTRLAPPLGMER